MTGRVTTLTATDGTIASNTGKSCTYHFTEAVYFGDWTALQTDFGGGATITVNFKPNPAVAGEATIVRRLA